MKKTPFEMKSVFGVTHQSSINKGQLTKSCVALSDREVIGTVKDSDSEIKSGKYVRKESGDYLDHAMECHLNEVTT